ncbi:hypothetical protein DRQ09_05085 [candidate division KSB1 bacterium]|nr:MAG: hypothetical protein DRQ09_05085 [candidate division KSB1 bacterium]
MADGKKSREELIKQLTSQVAAKRSSIDIGKKSVKKAPPVQKDTKPPEIHKKDVKKPPSISGFRRASRPVKDFSKEKLADKMFAGWKKALAKENSPEKVEEIVNSIIKGEKPHYTGTVEVEFEDNNIISISENPVKIDEEVKEQLIDKTKFQSILDYFENPLNAEPEIVLLAEGLSKEKIQKAIELKAEHIIKKPIVKLDGTIEYNIVASVKETSK